MIVDALEVDSPEALPRETLGGFHLVRRMATGGMASVYLGYRQRPNASTQVAAIKVMFPHLADDAEYVEMFFDEARLTSAVKHPNVCGVLDHGVEAGLHYLATEYLFGETWADLVDALQQTSQGRAVAPQLLAHIMTQACAGLHSVHETCDDHGKHLAIVHRDMSPQNIMICYDGTVRVLDFGIASAAERLHETRDGVLKGHLAYMAPEQMQGMPVDRRCDIWPLGVMLWEGVSGERLFKRANSHATMNAVATDALEPLLLAKQQVPQVLLSIILRAVVRDPAARFATARDFGNALSPLPLGTTPMTAPQVASWMRHLFCERFERKRLELKSALARGDEPTGSSRTAVRSTVGSAVQGAIPSIMPGDPGPNRGELLPTPAPVSTIETGRMESPALLSRLQRAAKRSQGPLLVLSLVAAGWLAKDATQTPEHRQESQRSAASQAPKQQEVAVEKPAASVPVPSEQSATVEVRASGGTVHILLAGRDLGTPPLRVELAQGRHLFRILPGAGGAPVDATMDVEAGERYAMDIVSSHPNLDAKR